MVSGLLYSRYESIFLSVDENLNYHTNNKPSVLRISQVQAVFYYILWTVSSVGRAVG